MSSEYSSSESSCNTARSSTNTSNNTPRSTNTVTTPRTYSAHSTPRDTGSGISSTSDKASSKYDESLIPKYYSQLLGKFHLVLIDLSLFSHNSLHSQSCVMEVYNIPL